MTLVRRVTAQLLREGHGIECAAFALNCSARLLGNRAGRREERRARGKRQS